MRNPEVFRLIRTLTVTLSAIPLTKANFDQRAIVSNMKKDAVRDTEAMICVTV